MFIFDGLIAIFTNVFLTNIGDRQHLVTRSDRSLPLLPGFRSESRVIPLDVDGAPPILSCNQNRSGASRTACTVAAQLADPVCVISVDFFDSRWFVSELELDI